MQRKQRIVLIASGRLRIKAQRALI